MSGWQVCNAESRISVGGMYVENRFDIVIAAIEGVAHRYGYSDGYDG